MNGNSRQRDTAHEVERESGCGGGRRVLYFKESGNQQKITRHALDASQANGQNTVFFSTRFYSYRQGSQRTRKKRKRSDRGRVGFATSLGTVWWASSLPPKVVVISRFASGSISINAPPTLDLFPRARRKRLTNRSTFLFYTYFSQQLCKAATFDTCQHQQERKSETAQMAPKKAAAAAASSKAAPGHATYQGSFLQGLLSRSARSVRFLSV